MTFHNDHNSDAHLIALLKAQDNMALDIIKNKYGNVLWTIVTRMLPDEDHELIFKEVIIKIWSSVKEYDANNGSVFIWVTSMTRNFCLDKVNELRDPNALLKVIETDDADANKDQSMFNLLFFEGYSYNDIAQKFNLPIETVGRWVRATIQELKRLDTHDSKSPQVSRIDKEGNRTQE